MDKTPVPEVQETNIGLSESEEQKCIEELKVLIKGLSYIIFFKEKINNLKCNEGSHTYLITRTLTKIRIGLSDQKNIEIINLKKINI